ncbi:MAG: putative integral rane protein [Arthrobacter sp.]|nr:putative integral rane protein [Arthrobacter sp.]
MATTNRSSAWSLRRFLRGLLHGPLPAEDAARRVSAFVYGDVLVLAALVALDPEDLNGPKAVAYVVGTGVSTFVAHVLAESVGFGVRTDQSLTREHLRHELRDSLPIISATSLPALLMIAALLGWLETVSALQLGIGVTVFRLAALGWVVGHLRRRRASGRTFLSGVLLALAGGGAAVLKWWLTH